MRRLQILLVVLATMLVATKCPPKVQIAASGVDVYNGNNSALVISAGDPIGVRVPLENIGYGSATSLQVVAELLDKNGATLQQLDFTLPKVSSGSTPVYDFHPFDSGFPDLIDDFGTGTFRITFSAADQAPSIHDERFTIRVAEIDLGPFETFAAAFTPFETYPPGPGIGACAPIWSDSLGLLGALELHARDPLHPLAISPATAEPYAEHLAVELLPRVYDPEAPGTEGSCGFGINHPDTTTAVAVLAYMLKIHGAGWSNQIREALRRLINLPAWSFLPNLTVYNKSIAHPTMRLLFGEAACHAPSWDWGWNRLSDMFYGHLVLGGHEAHDLHYTPYHTGNLGLLDGLDSPVPNKMARALFDLKALLAAHMYLPGGQLGTLYSRTTPFFFPGVARERALGPIVVALGAGDDFVYADVDLDPHGITMLTAVAAARNPLEPAIRSLFRNKGDGYEAWWLQRYGRSIARFPGTISNLGEAGGFAHAWHFAVLPGGIASMGTGYGAWTQDTGNKEGAAVRCPGCEQSFAQIYQWQAKHPIDTDDSGALISTQTPPEAAITSGYDAERMQVHRTRISLFDPRSRTSRWGAFAGIPVPRGDERSLAFLPNWDHPVVGGEKIFPTTGGWYVGRVDDVFIAYRPLGDSIQTSLIDGQRLDGGTNVDYATFFELDGRSGGITILSTADEFPGDTLADFAAEMDARFWSFTAAGPNDGPVAELDYRAADGSICRMKLEYMGVGGLPGMERRYISCLGIPGLGYEEQHESTYFEALYGGQLMTSPFVSYDIQADILTVDVPSFPPIEYDWGALRYPLLEPPVGCSDRAYLELPEPISVELATASLSPVPAFDAEIQNTGFGPTTVVVSFEGDDCTPSGATTNFDWLDTPALPESIAPGSTATIAIAGDSAGCQSGEWEGELVFSTLEGNALETRLPVTLIVSASPAGPVVSLDVTLDVCASGPLRDDEIGHSGCTTPRSLGIPEAADVVAFDTSPNGACQLFSLDVTTTLAGGVLAEPRDVACYDPVSGSYSILFDGSAAGVPVGVGVDAVSEHPSGDLLLSFDTTAEFGLALPTRDEDIVRFDFASFTDFFRGADEGLSDSLDLDALHYRASDGHLLVSFDVSGNIDGSRFDDEDVLAFDPISHAWSLAIDGSSETTSLTSTDVVAVPEPTRLLLLVPGASLLAWIACSRRRINPRRISPRRVTRAQRERERR